MNIEINSNPTTDFLEQQKVFQWPIWTKEISQFPWIYDDQEKCYFLEGEVTVTPDGGNPLTVKKGDFVIFPAGMKCTWNISSAVKKHYNFG